MNRINQLSQISKTLFFIAGVVLAVDAQATVHLPDEGQGERVEHRYYHLSYVEEYEQAEWVSYRLTAQMLEGRARRRNNFRRDPAVRTGSASSREYSHSGYSRGHLVPAGDMKVNSTAMSETFFMSNMSPQDYQFNSGIWNQLENQVRDWVREKDELLIVSGPVLHSQLGRLPNSDVAIPDLFFKILLFKGHRAADHKMIAFLMANEDSERPLADFVVTVDHVERLTGIDFFPDLEGERFLESRIETSSWFSTRRQGFFNSLLRRAL